MPKRLTEDKKKTLSASDIELLLKKIEDLALVYKNGFERINQRFDSIIR